VRLMDSLAHQTNLSRNTGLEPCTALLVIAAAQRVCMALPTELGARSGQDCAESIVAVCMRLADLASKHEHDVSLPETEIALSLCAAVPDVRHDTKPVQRVVFLLSLFRERS
jgi:hypothetical protein